MVICLLHGIFQFFKSQSLLFKFLGFVDYFAEDLGAVEVAAKPWATVQLMCVVGGS
jgi:hypothetical protein